MGRLYDKEDLRWNTEWWNGQETHLHIQIANGLVDKSILDKIMTYPGSRSRERYNSSMPRHVRLRDAFELERKRERFKLLRTSQLIQELDEQVRIFKACPQCHRELKQGKTVDVPCKKHRDAYRKAKSDVYWAGEHNLEERNLRGQRRSEGLSTEDALEGTELRAHSTDEPQNGLNEWERMYFRAKADGTLAQDAVFYDEEPSYKGYLRILLQEDEMSEQQFMDEMARLSREAREAEQLDAPTDRNLPSALPKYAGRGKQFFRRDTRFNRLSA